MAQTKDIGLSPERIKEAQKRHATIDPGCLDLSLEEITNWHPVGGISWEERAQRMKALGLSIQERKPELQASIK
jgi:hypothetical protein